MGRGNLIGFNTCFRKLYYVATTQKFYKRALGNRVLFVYRNKLVKVFQIVRTMKRKFWKKDVQRLMMKMIVKMAFLCLMDISQKMR